MFDKFIVEKGENIPYTKHVSVNVGRAPTDESIKLLNEMQKAAEDNLISITKLENNSLRLTWHLFHDANSFYPTAKCRMLLNDKEYRFDVELKKDQFITPDNVIKEIHKALLTELSKIICLDMFCNDDIRQVLINKNQTNTVVPSIAQHPSAYNTE